MIEQIFILLIVFQVKHFLCDYPLQTEFMLGKSKVDDWVHPLTLHCLTHATGTLLVISVFTDFDSAYICFIIDYWFHFAMDRVKAAPHLLGRFKPDNKYFWWALGGDQAWHHLTHYLIIYLALTN